jgi:alcohol dehydrogenase
MISMHQPFRFTHRTDIVFGSGRIENIADELDRLEIRKPLIVTDSGLMRAGVTDPLISNLERAEREFHVFDGVVPNPRIGTVEDGVQVLTAQECNGVIGIGGGSSMDTSKAIAGLAANGGNIEEYEGIEQFHKAALPIITVPTTIGTGSEVTSAAVITHPARTEKLGILDNYLIPDSTILDPDLLRSLPPQLAASTGMDCLTQSIMAFLSTDANPITDILTKAAVEKVFKNLPAAVAKKDQDALIEMQLATTIEGIGFMNAGLGLVHAMSHPVSARYDTPHGVTNGVILPAVLDYNRIARESKYAELAVAIGIPDNRRTQRELSFAFIKEVKSLAASLGIPPGLAALGVDEEDIPELADAVVSRKDTQRNKSTNPRVSTRDDIEEIYKAAM